MERIFASTLYLKREFANNWSCNILLQVTLQNINRLHHRNIGFCNFFSLFLSAWPGKPEIENAKTHTFMMDCPNKDKVEETNFSKTNHPCFLHWKGDFGRETQLFLPKPSITARGSAGGRKKIIINLAFSWFGNVPAECFLFCEML